MERQMTRLALIVMDWDLSLSRKALQSSAATHRGPGLARNCQQNYRTPERRER
jgi:hypothetical protein